MLPMLSNDVFSVLSYGAVAAGGHDVYTTTSWLPQGLFYPYLGAHWMRTVCVYGPTTLLASLPAGLARGSPWVGLLLLRLAWLVPLIVVMELSLRRLPDRPFFHTMVWLNPLWVVEGPGQLHADLLGLVAITAGIVLHRGGKVRASFALYAAALLGKYSFGPAGLWFWLSGAPLPGQRARRLLALVAVVLAVTVAVYLPFWQGPGTVIVPLQALGRMNPGGSITEVLGILFQLLVHGSVTPPDMAVQTALEVDRAAKQASWLVVSWIARIVFLAVVARVLPRMLRKTADERTVALGTGALTVALLTLASHRFQCWYLLAPLPFFGLECPPVWRRWWTAAVAVAVPVDFACVLERTSPVYPVWGALSTGTLVVVFRPVVQGPVPGVPRRRRRSTRSHKAGSTVTAARRQHTSPTTAIRPRLRIARLADPSSARYPSVVVRLQSTTAPPVVRSAPRMSRAPSARYLCTTLTA